MMISPRLAVVLAIVGLGGTAWTAERPPQNTEIKRYTVVVGANFGGSDRVRLQYAVEDARSMCKVLQELGGVAEENNILLVDPGVSAFRSEVDKLNRKIRNSRSAQNRIEIFFYYSGHSDEKNILLGAEKLSYEDVRDLLAGIDADVRIAILDSCASGAFTRLKGGKKRVPFLLDSAFDMKGTAIMTSSSSTEASQESDLLKGSFFTHYLISGLRGAADMTQDGRVTLSEAYQFAFNETLAETAKTEAGPQHPNYDIQMSGTGDVVMTDIRKGASLLVLAEDLSGKIFIHDERNKLVVELTKPAGRTIELGLEDGRYRVIRVSDQAGVFEAYVALTGERNVRLGADGLTRTNLVYTTPRGDRSARVRNESLLSGRSSTTPFFIAGVGMTKNSTGTAVTCGGALGLTFESAFSVGLSAFTKVNNAGGYDFNYAGIYAAYALHPERKIHFRLIGGMGVGKVDHPDPQLQNYLYVTAGVEVLLRILPTLRVGFVTRLGWTDQHYDSERVRFGINLHFGK